MHIDETKIVSSTKFVLTILKMSNSISSIADYDATVRNLNRICQSDDKFVTKITKSDYKFVSECLHVLFLFEIVFRMAVKSIVQKGQDGTRFLP